jgi:hypothetical protein
MNAQDLNTKTLAELTAIYNASADQPIKKFTCSRDKAIERILNLETIETVSTDELVEDGGDGFVPAIPLEKTVKTKKLGIGKRITELLKLKTPTKDVLATIKAEFEGCKTTMACVYWYASKINLGQL